MTLLRLPARVLCVGAAVCLLVACQRESKPPPPLALEKVPSELVKNFSGAAPGVRDIVEKINIALNEKDFSNAYQGVQILCSLREATDQQRMISTRAMLTLTTVLQQAQAAGDQEAKSTLSAQKALR
jgi:hypothetical protein